MSSVFLAQPVVILKTMTYNIMHNKDLFVLQKVYSLLELLTVSVIKYCFQITITSNLIIALVKQWFREASLTYSERR